MTPINIFDKIIRIGTKALSEDSLLFTQVIAMNKISLVMLWIGFTLIPIGLFIPYSGYVIVGAFISTIIIVSLIFTSLYKYHLAWHLVFILPVLVLIFLSFFAITSPALIIFFVSLLTLVMVFFQDKRLLTFYFFYYAIGAITFLFFLFELNPHNINENVWINIYSSTIGLVITYASLQFFIVQKQRTENEFRIQEEKYRALFEKSPFGIMVSTVSNNNKTVNQALANILGYTIEELEKNGVAPFSHPDDVHLHLAGFEQLLNSEIDFFELEKRYLHKNGTPVWNRIVVTNVKDSSEKLMHTVATFLNITEQKEQQQKISDLIEKLQKANLELELKIEERTAALTIANEELQRSNQDLEQFAYVASHDLKEPLRMIGSFIQIINRKYSDKLDDKGKEYISFTVEGVQRMSDLISSLLQYSRVGRKESTIRVTNIRNVIEGKLFDLKQLIDDKNATIHIQNLPLSLNCEPVQIGLVFYNLIMNGLKFNENTEPSITIDAKETDRHVIFSISDNGIGIEDKFKEKVFEIFKRLHTRDKYDGTGIGLALCRKIVYRHDGDIWLESEKGNGTTFYFSISKDLRSASNSKKR